MTEEIPGQLDLLDEVAAACRCIQPMRVGLHSGHCCLADGWDDPAGRPACHPEEWRALAAASAEADR